MLHERNQNTTPRPATTPTDCAVGAESATRMPKGDPSVGPTKGTTLVAARESPLERRRAGPGPVRLYSAPYSLNASTSALSFFKPPTSFAQVLIFRIVVRGSLLPVAATLATARCALLRRPRRPFILPLIKYTRFELTLMFRSASLATTS